MAQVWPGLVVSTETVVQRVKLLRAALHENPNAPRYIASMRGRGYHLVVEVVRHEAAAIVPSLVEPRALDDLAVTRVIAAPGTPSTPRKSCTPWWWWYRPHIAVTLVAAGVLFAGVAWRASQPVETPPLSVTTAPPVADATARTVAVLPLMHEAWVKIACNYA